MGAKVTYRLVFAWLCIAPSTTAVACSLNEAGVGDASSSSDATVNDGPSDAPLDVPQACSTLDATACVDAALPSDWTYVIVGDGDIACPFTDLTDRSVYITSLAPSPNACSCTCAATGSYSCAGTIAAGGKGNGGGCGTLSTFDAGDDAECIDESSWNDPHISVGPLPSPSGVVGCSPQPAVANAWTASATTACTPGCSVDYCGASGAFKRCIVSSTSQTCPAPFAFAGHVGVDSGVNVVCSPCTCAVDTPGPCNAQVIAYNDNACAVAVSDAAVATDGACEQPGGGTHISSFSYTPIVPQPKCTVTDAGVASAQFAPALTVCCL